MAAKLADVDASLEQLDTMVAKQADTLLELDGSPGHALLVTMPLTGASREAANTALAELGDVWRAYEVLKDVVDRARVLRRHRVDAHGLAELDALLDGWSVPEIFDYSGLRLDTPPDGVSASDPSSLPTPPVEIVFRPPFAEGMFRPRDLARQVGRRLRRLRRTVEAFDDTVRGHLAALAEARRTIDGLAETAGRIGAHDEHDEMALATANHILVETEAAVATDPLSADIEGLASAVADAVAHIGDLARRHDGLDDDLRDAAALLEKIIKLADAGQEKARQTRARIARPGTLLRLEDGWLDGRRPGLRPRLERLRALAAAGRWREASLGLTRWQEYAEATREAANQAATTNGAPLRRRDELRGEFGACHSKAAKLGLANRPGLVELGRLAAAALYAAPTDVDEAARHVSRYAAALAALSGHHPSLPGELGVSRWATSRTAERSDGIIDVPRVRGVGTLGDDELATLPTLPSWLLFPPGPPRPAGPGSGR